jgi:hypothetical protein
MATFNGTDKSTCPNMSEPAGQERFAEFINFGHSVGEGNIDPQFGTPDFNRICFNICETGGIDENGVPENSHYIDANGICRDCPEPGDTEGIEEIGDDMAEMCANLPQGQGIFPNTTSPTWFIRHQEYNLREDFIGLDIDWTDTSNDGPKSYWRDADRGLTDDEILSQIGTRRPGTTEYSLPAGYDNMSELRNAINEGRGSVVVCNDDNRPVWITETNPCIVGDDNQLHFGPNHIVIEELRHFIIYLQSQTDGQDSSAVSSVIQSFSELLSGISGDSTFEACINDKLNTGDDDSEIQSRIATYDRLSQFSNEDINYLKRKLRRIVVIRTDDVNECMNLLNLGQSVCTTGVADKTLQIGRLIFSIVGNDKIDVLDMDNDERIKLNKMIDELGPLIPQAIKNIIHVSKEYETRICNVPSNTTLLLERVYTDLYDKPTNINLDISPYIDFNSLININDNMKFIKTIIVLIVFSYLFMHFANILTAFFSRGK